MKTSRVSRVVQMLTTLQSGRPRKAGELSKIFGISRRTLYRDLKELERIGVTPSFSPEHKGYQISREQFLPPINLNLQEALSVLLLIHKMRGQIQLPFKNAALLAALKIESTLPPRVRRYCESALEKISARANAQAPTPKTPGLDRVFGIIQSATAQRRKVAIRYDSFFDERVIECDLSAYHLFYNQRAWYVVGYSSVHKEVRTFKLNRIKDARILDTQYNDGENFDLSDYIGSAWSMIPEGRIYNVRLRFSPKVAGNVAEVQWHGSQKVERDDDGSVIIEFRVDGLNEITWWVLGYGDQVEVLAPLQLRRRLAETAKKMAEINSD
ncbi:MAG: transcriptional regulator [Sedimentisphaerales bacterium]|nr:transcriptional regulator [Sedimentisphaerales bacterium]